MLVEILPKYFSIIRQDVDRTVVMAAVDAIHEILNKIGAPVLQMTSATDVILSVVKEIFTHKVLSLLMLWYINQLSKTFLKTKNMCPCQEFQNSYC